MHILNTKNVPSKKIQMVQMIFSLQEIDFVDTYFLYIESTAIFREHKNDKNKTNND